MSVIHATLSDTMKMFACCNTLNFSVLVLEVGLKDAMFLSSGVSWYTTKE